MRLKNWIAVMMFAAMLVGVSPAQNLRWDLTATTTNGVGQLVPVYAIPGATIGFYTGCTSLPCLTPATTYISQSSSTTCGSTTQVTYNNPATTTCYATADSQGNFGAWFAAAGGIYQYTITVSGYVSGPYNFTLGSGGVPAAVVCAGYNCQNYNQSNANFTTTSLLQLSMNVGSTDTTINVMSTSGFPNVGCGYLAAPVEYFCWTSKTGTALTMPLISYRGLNGTTASSHVTGTGTIAGAVFTFAACPTCIQSLSLLNNGAGALGGGVNPGLNALGMLPSNTYLGGLLSGNISSVSQTGYVDAWQSIGYNYNDASGILYNTAGFAARLLHTFSTTATSDIFHLDVYNTSNSLVGTAYSWDGTGAFHAPTSLNVGGGAVISNSNSLPQVGTPSANQAACIKSVGPPVVIGYCSTVVSSAGACTCN